jgi:hypothetical protein
MLVASLELSGGLQNLEADFKLAVETKFHELAEQLYQKVMANLSGKILQRQSGQLAGSIRKEVDTGGDTLIAIVGPEVESPKAWALEKGGEKYYAIVPVKAKALHFYWTKIGQEVWLPYVDHPPSKEFGYLARALAEMYEIAPEEMALAIERALSG